MSISRDVLQACVHPTTDWTEGIKFGPDQTSGPYPVGLSQENRTPHFWFPRSKYNYRNIWSPRIIYFNFAEIFGPS